ncbi:MAG: beta-ketoacyl synthase N-terminal-like domain-containing protein, partial [Myxococcota bacterium]|nr:beta-ketoacyl synthase N-terminal-like domain-containing protein [Myxococcota bacterium]
MRFEPIAIVGQACIFPGALTPSALWDQIRAGRDLTSRVPAGRWGLSSSRLVRDAGDPRGTKDATWCDRGGYVDGFESIFDPTGFALDASKVRALDPLFQWVLHTGREALRDAGVAHTGRTGAVFGNLSFPSSGMARFAERVWLGEQRAALAAIPSSAPENRFMSGLPAHLLAKALSLGASAYCLDAACASSLYAIKLACDQLHDGKADIMLAGAVNRADDLFIHVGFTALKALSATGQSRPFHPDADGLVPAEGAGFVVLKRLGDAERNGDSILGVIRGVGLSNDGRGGGFLAPSSEGQVRAMQAAYAMSGLSPSDISLVECHATGTTVGDGTELRSMGAVFAEHPDLPIGSIKGNMGHPITAAGVAGLIKVLGALQEHVIPPSRHAAEGSHTLEGTPFRLATHAEPWISDGPRRAALSAFGFGGNNAHLIVEEYTRTEPQGSHPPAVPQGALAIVGMGARVGDGRGLEDFEGALFGARGVPSTRMDTLDLAVQGLKFPPRDLEQALGQQLTMLAAAREALERTGQVDPTRSGVFVGMGCDPEVARYGVRWRMQDWAPYWGEAEPGVVSTLEDAAVSHLESPGVLGTMPNVVANRLSSQFDFTGQGFTVSSEELSGVRALELAMRALRSGELDTALVGAVDMSCEAVHQSALSQLGLPEDTGDGAIALVVERLEEAQANGRTIYALIDDQGELPAWQQSHEVLERTGKPHAARGLIQVAALALCLGQRRALGGTPWYGQTGGGGSVTALAGLATTLPLHAGQSQIHPTPPRPLKGPTLAFSVHAGELVFPDLASGATMAHQSDNTLPLLPLAPDATTVQVMAAAPALAPVTMEAAPHAGVTEVQTFIPPPEIMAHAADLSTPANTTQPSAPSIGGLVGALVSYRQHMSRAHIAFAEEQARAQAKLMELQAQARYQLLELHPGFQRESLAPLGHTAGAQAAAAPASRAPLKSTSSSVYPTPPLVRPQIEARTPLAREASTPATVAPTQRTPESKPGLKLSRAQLEVHASGKISEIYGSLF